MEQLKTHISDESFRAFQENRLSASELKEILEHTSHCTFCADRLAKSFEEASLYRAPKNFKEAILTKTEPPVQAPKFPGLTMRQQLFFYSTKICVAMGIVLFILFTLPVNENFNKPVLPERQKPSVTEQLNNSLNQAAYSINEKMNEFLSYYFIKEEY